MAKRLIYAEDALDLIDQNRAFMSDVGRIHARNAVNEAPTVDAKPVVRGRWENWQDRFHTRGMDLHCSICHHRASRFVGGTEDWWDMWEPDFCPNCGADMRGAEDGRNEV